eukprot:gene3641-4158_t
MTDASACGHINDIPGISFFTATASTLLTIATTALHAAILYAIIKDREKKFKLFFYKLLFNISIADILSGLINDPYSVIFHTQEGLLKKTVDQRGFHVTLFLFGSVPLATMVVLCIDRILSLIRPMEYRNGVQGWKSWAVLGFIWVISMLQILIYFQMGFIPYLIVFAAVNIAMASIAMIVTFGVFRRKLGRRLMKHQSIGSAVGNRVDETLSRRRDQRQRQETRATRTFLIMSVVILLSYMPTCFAAGYMNSCRNCNCAIVHSLRDIAIVSILAGPMFRAINFLLCLKSLRCVFVKVEKGPSDTFPASSEQQKVASSEQQKVETPSSAL